MHNLAHKLPPHPRMEYARVLVRTSDGYAVHMGGNDYDARLAPSCLLRPSPGDEVLVSLDDSGRCYILAVLERAAPHEDACLDFPGHVHMHAPNGGVNIMAKDDVTIGAGDECNILGRQFNLLADKGDIRVEDLSLLGKTLKANVQAVRVVAEHIETAARRLVQRLRDLFCFVEEQSDMQSKNARHVVEETLTMHSKNAFHVADEIVKVDGEQVHLG